MNEEVRTDSISLLKSTTLMSEVKSNQDKILEVIPSSELSNKLSLDALLEQCNIDKLIIALTKIKEVIRVSTTEGSFSCIISNDILEDLFTVDNAEEFDDALMLAAVRILKELGYKVKYNEIVYSDISNLLEISW